MEAVPSRKRSRSGSTSSSCSNNCSDSSSSSEVASGLEPDSPRRLVTQSTTTEPGARGAATAPPPAKRKCSSSRDLERRFDLLSQQLVSQFNNMIYAHSIAARSNLTNCSASTSNSLPVTTPHVPFSTSVVMPSVEHDQFLRPPPVPSLKVDAITDLSVSIKDPVVAKAIPERVAKISAMQRFESPDWNAVRYTDIQKKYAAFPAFTELRVNEELRRLEDPFAPIRWYQMERSFAALSNAFLGQNESVNSALQALVDWSASPGLQLTPSCLFEKLTELFGKDSNYKAVSHDILQIICGKRAEVLELRRRSLLKPLKDKYLREDIEKIPPSAEYMFNPQPLASYLQKVGGIDKLQKEKPKGQPPRPKSPVPSTSYQEKTFQSRPTKRKQNDNKNDSNYRKNYDTFVDKKKGGRQSKGARRTGRKQK